ncbi:hypothetical protein D047_2631A, partial [Vibrio parahaemolyticus VPTS-2010_2]
MSNGGINRSTLKLT